MKRRTFAHWLALVVALFALSPLVQAQETMTVEKFREIASSPGDNVPLDPKLLAVGPILTNASITVDVNYADGRTFKETIPGSLKTIKGKYIVTTVKSSLYQKPIWSRKSKPHRRIRSRRMMKRLVVTNTGGFSAIPSRKG